MGSRSQTYHGIELMISSVLVAKRECSKFSVRVSTNFYGVPVIREIYV